MAILRPRVFLVAALLAVALGGLPAGDVLGQKKGGGTPPPPAPGTIYFSGWVSTSGGSGAYDAMSMNGDGTDKNRVIFGLHRTPSYQTHGGSRWFFMGDYDWDGPYNDDGIPLAWELFAVNQQNQWVQLTGDPNLHVSAFGTPAWGKDDSFVSYAAWWFTGNGDEVRGGLFYADIDWSSGAPVAGPPTLLFEAGAVWYYDWQGDVNVHEHDWSPGGDAVAFRTEEELGSAIYVADFSGEAPAVGRLAAGDSPDWSPNGSRIAFGNGEIWTIDPDGSNAFRLTQRTVSKSETRGQGGPSWSPDGTYVTYTEAVTSKTKTSTAVMRIPSGGGTAVNLTGDLDRASGPRWRP